MKHSLLKTAVLFVLFTLLTTSCEKVKELVTIDVNTKISREIPVVITSAQNTIQGDFIFDFSDNEEVKKYDDKIQNIQITSGHYEISDYKGEPSAKGTISVKLAEQEFGPYPHSFKNDDDSDKKFVFDDEAKLKIISSSLVNDKKITVKFSVVNSNSEDATFTVKATLKLKITTQPLK